MNYKGELEGFPDEVVAPDQKSLDEPKVGDYVWSADGDKDVFLGYCYVLGEILTITASMSAERAKDTIKKAGRMYVKLNKEIHTQSPEVRRLEEEIKERQARLNELKNQ